MSEDAVQTRRDEEGLQSRRDAPVGGQAVLEGVMMRGVSTWAVAGRKPPPGQVPEGPMVGRGEGPPGPGGVVALAESLKIGFKALGISASSQADDHDAEIGRGTWAGTVVVSIVFAIG